ncbi:unnamed protein product [Chironomus riparius]|uniref:Peptidase S1 domain-containing protein n=1 Tax=Chironomus riparius TaxID=315576 RepID=A0A9N9RIM2_9DIPT|nr:unnamed protein product [Chironomus riparius]
MNKLILIVLTLIVLFEGSWSFYFSCNLDKKGFLVLNNVDFCNVVGDFSIKSSEDAFLTSTNLTETNLAETIGIRFREKTCYYFPQNLANVLSDRLQVIEISYGQLKEIHQHDLSPFKDLKVLYLEKNDIEILEIGIFDYNIKLQFIYFGDNKIKHIGTGVFTKLSQLTHLNLFKNDCIDKNSENNKEVKTIQDLLKINCKDIEYVKQCENLKQLENAKQTLNLDDFQMFYNNLKEFEELIMSKYPNSSLVTRVHILKDWSFEILWRNVSRMNHFMTNFSEIINYHIYETMKKCSDDIQKLDEKIVNNLKAELEKYEKRSNGTNGEESYLPFWLGVSSILTVVLLIFLIKNSFSEERVISYSISEAKRYVRNDRTHCTYQYNTNISVRVGSTFKEKGGKTYDIVKIINYPLFDILKLNYDYALLKPDREILFDYVNGTVRPVKLSEQNQVMVDDTICTVSGWGKADNDTRPDKLRFVDVKVVNQTVCQACYNTPKVRFKITDFMMCAGYMEGGRDACSGEINYL